MDRATFERVVELTRSRSIVIVSDEVYRELEHNSQDRLPAACDLDERAVSLGSISKSYGLPGLRIGWLVTRDSALREAVLRLKDYTTICSSAPSERLAGPGVLLLPGSAYDRPAHVRIGFGRANMLETLEVLENDLGVTSTARA